MNSPEPIRENAEKGFDYTVTDEQIAEHQKRTVREIFQMMEAHAKFLYEIQTPEERERMRIVKGKYRGPAIL